MERISADWLKKTTWLVPFLWIMLAFLAFRETLDVFFVQDDFWFLEAVNQPLPNRMMLTGVLPDYLRPLPTFWFMLANRGLWGLNSIGFHLVLIGFFSATLYLVYSLTRSLTGSCLTASAGAVV